MMAVVAPAARPLPLPYLAAASNRTPCRSLWSSPARAMPAAAAPKGGAKKDGASGRSVGCVRFEIRVCVSGDT